MNVYRGIPLDGKESYAGSILNLRIGDVYSDLGYMSTSHSNGKAVEYGVGDKENPKPKLVFMEIELKKGTNCVPLF